MKHRSHSKLVRALSLIIIAACAFARFGSFKARRESAGSGTAGMDPPRLDLIPSITRGLDLVWDEGYGVGDTDGSDGSDGADGIGGGDADEPKAAEVRIGVFNGERVVPMALNDYLIGVTAAEMPASYGLEALKAQAVAARTFTLKHMTGELKCKSGHTVCTDHTCCQAYITVEGMRKNWGERFDAYYEKIRSAVEGTDAQVLTSGGKLVTALYHSSSGGRTENCEAVFAVALPYLVSVESAGEEDSPEFQSTVRYTKDEFIEKINSAFPDSSMSDPKKDVEVWQRTESGRVSLIRLGGTVVSGQQVRNALKLKSTNMEFTVDGDSVEISCLGFGHGVGMSQCGANAMAKEGADYEAILKHYYTGVEIEVFSHEPQLWKLLCEDGG